MNILIINGYETYTGVGEGRLNSSLCEIASDILSSKNHTIQTTIVEQGYDAPSEVEKLLWADAVIFQTPVYWFGVPAIFKTYMDKVCTLGYATGKFATGDGRSRENSELKYGSGGLLKNKKYMVSSTWNAPKSVFDNKAEFLEGLSVDDALCQIHKTYQFLGMSKIPSFAVFDVFKSSEEVAAQVEDFKKHIEENF